MKRNKTALITGSSSGIGKAIAIQLAAEGIDVCINYSRSQDMAEKVKQYVESHDGHAIICKADITKEEEVKKMFNFISDEFGALDVLVNNAGIYIPDYIDSEEITIWEKTMKINVYGKFLCTKFAVPLLKKSFSPRIINISSRAGERPMTESSAYCSAAAAIIMFTKVSALELAKYNIKVNSVSPGLTKTALTEKYDTEEDFTRYVQRNPSKRIGEPKDIANTISFLISEKASFINGENINVSGGILLT